MDSRRGFISIYAVPYQLDDGLPITLAPLVEIWEIVVIVIRRVLRWRPWAFCRDPLVANRAVHAAA
jgi:hypothetical protein